MTLLFDGMALLYPDWINYRNAIQCAARITRHRAISLRTCSLAFLFPILFLRHIVKNYWKQECKKRAFRNGFSGLWEARILIFSDFGGPGVLSGGPEAHREDFWDCSDFGGAPGAKK